MTYDDFVRFPFIDLGVFLLFVSFAVQIARGKIGFGVLIELLKASRSHFDESTDAVIVSLARRFNSNPDEVRNTIGTLYLIATGEPLAIEAQAKLDDAVTAKLGITGPEGFPKG